MSIMDYISDPLPGRHDRFEGVPTPPSIADPSGVLALELFCIIFGTSFIIYHGYYSLRQGRWTYGFLFLVNSLLVYWMETIGDWGQHLIYSPRFWCHSLLNFLPLKSPNDPVFIPFAYATYWTAHSIMLMSLAPYLQRYFKKMTLLQAVLIISLPLNYAFDIFVEGFCTYMGWWTYDPGFGPVIEWSNGGHQPLTWPILLMSGWPNFVAYWAGKPPLTKLNIMEKWFKLDRWTEPKKPQIAPARGNDDEESEAERSPLIGRGDFAVTALTMQEAYDAALEYRVIDSVPRWKFEMWRFLAWFIVFQVSFFVNFIIPLVGLRMITGRESIYAP